MSVLPVSEVSTRREYWRNTVVTPTKIQSSWRRIFVDRSYHIGRAVSGRMVGKPEVMFRLSSLDNFRFARHPPIILLNCTVERSERRGRLARRNEIPYTSLARFSLPVSPHKRAA